jgi:hypothetical protein
MDESIVEHIYYERGKSDSKDNSTKKKLQLWQDGYDKGFADAQEKLAKLFDKKLSEILKEKDFT